MNETPLIHLESFNRKEDALLWLGKNYIEGAFIELGSSIKSIDSYGISGNFNVVIEYEDLIKGVETLKSIFKSPIQNIVDRYGGAQGPDSEGWVRQRGGNVNSPFARAGAFAETPTNISNQNLIRLLGRATSPATQSAATRVGEGGGPVGGVAPLIPSEKTPSGRGAGAPNAFDSFRENSRPKTGNTGNQSGNAFNQFRENSDQRNSGVGGWSSGTSAGRSPTSSSTSRGTPGVPTIELVRETPNQTGSIPEGTKNTPEKDEGKRRGAGFWGQLGRSLLPAALALPLILGGWTGNETPINFPKEPTGRGHTIEILNPDTPGTPKPPAAQRINLFDTPTTEKPPTEKPPTTATTPDKNVVEKAVHMVIKSLIERGIIA
jgi:hypothetical protein